MPIGTRGWAKCGKSLNRIYTVRTTVWTFLVFRRRSVKTQKPVRVHCLGRTQHFMRSSTIFFRDTVSLLKFILDVSSIWSQIFLIQIRDTGSDRTEFLLVSFAMPFAMPFCLFCCFSSLFYYYFFLPRSKKSRGSSLSRERVPVPEENIIQPEGHNRRFRHLILLVIQMLWLGSGSKFYQVGQKKEYNSCLNLSNF